jgi:HPt (histidine-containing phosphotransfer) domain-containing protein
LSVFLRVHMTDLTPDKLIDYDVIRGYAPDGAEKEILRELNDYFQMGVPKRLNQARESINDNNLKMLCEHLHALKNSFLNVGARTVAEECQTLENEVPTTAPAEILNRIQALDNQFHLVQLEINDLLAQH